MKIHMNKQTDDQERHSLSKNVSKTLHLCLIEKNNKIKYKKSYETIMWLLSRWLGGNCRLESYWTLAASKSVDVKYFFITNDKLLLVILTPYVYNKWISMEVDVFLLPTNNFDTLLVYQNKIFLCLSSLKKLKEIFHSNPVN